MRKRERTGWIVVTPPCALAPLGSYGHIPPKGEPVVVHVQGPLTLEQQQKYDRDIRKFMKALGRMAADQYIKGKVGCMKHNTQRLDIVVDTPTGTFAACSLCYQEGVYDDVIGEPRPHP